MPAGLAETYLEAFTRLYEKFKQAGKLHLYQQVLGVVLVAKEPLPRELLRSALGYNNDRAFRLEVANAASNLLLFDVETGTARPPRKST